jgi:hypothetical protein
MVSKKIVSSDHTMQVLFNEYSEDDLIAGSNSNQSLDSEGPTSAETTAISEVSDFIHGTVINRFAEYFCDQTNSHSSQIIGAVPCPFTKRPLFQTWPLVRVPTLETFLGLMFVCRIQKLNLRIYWTKDTVTGIPICSNAWT